MPQDLALVSTVHLALSAAWLLVTFRRPLPRAVPAEIVVAGLWATAWLATGAPLDFIFPATAAVAAGVAHGIRRTFPVWSAPGQALWAAVLLAAVTFLAYAAATLLAARAGPASLALGVILLALQAGALLLLLIHTFETVDVLCRRRWRRVSGLAPLPERPPKVSLHVPIHNEPPALVIQTLNALARLDYPDYEVVVVDNNTADEALWRPVEAHCALLGRRFRFFHVRPLAGYKAGALNVALRHTAPDAEIVGVVDADYVVEPEFLRDLAGHFADPACGFVQTPQDYRDGDGRGRYGRALYLAYQYFFSMSMASRNERNAIIYAGTMGLIRRRAIEEAGGWDEWCITEDAEVSLRLLDAGWTSHFVDRSYGRGIMPLDYAGLRRQRFRWAFGGMQILRLHWRKLFGLAPGGLTVAQRVFYLTGWLQWLNDALALAFALLLLIGAAAVVAGGGLLLQPLAGAAITIPLFFVFFAVFRFLWGFRVRSACSWREAIGAFTVLLGLTTVVALACARGMVARGGVFLRTPKSGARPALGDTLRLVRWEVGLGVLCLTAAALVAAAPMPVPVRLLGGSLLTWKTVTFWSAGVSAVWDWHAARRCETTGAGW